MNELFELQNALLSQVNNHFKRYLFENLPWKERFVCIKGLRGVGKTTMMLQYLKYELGESNENLYVTMDHPYFFTHSLIDLAKTFSLNGGKFLFVDEVHKMQGWSLAIKYIYDAFPDLQLIISSSSALELLKGEADLSRRLAIYHLGGLSFREYLILKHGIIYPKIEFKDLIKHHVKIANQCLAIAKPIPLFKEYLESGYYPFAINLSKIGFQTRLMQTLDTTLNIDMAYINGYSPEHTFKIKKLLGVIVESSPFSINVSNIADKLGISRNTVKEYVHALEAAGVLQFLNRAGKGSSTLQKPDKIYLENTNLAYLLKSNSDIGNVRESFVINQLHHAGMEVEYPKESGDIYLPSEEVIIEIGGKKKTKHQIAQIENAFIAADDLEIGALNKVPLYLFGLLY